MGNISVIDPITGMINFAQLTNPHIWIPISESRMLETVSNGSAVHVLKSAPACVLPVPKSIDIDKRSRLY